MQVSGVVEGRPTQVCFVSHENEGEKNEKRPTVGGLQSEYLEYCNLFFFNDVHGTGMCMRREKKDSAAGAEWHRECDVWSADAVHGKIRKVEG